MLHTSRRALTLTPKVYELRWYDIKPDCVGAYAAITKEKFGLRTKHSKLCGFWSVEGGDALNQFFHIWEYDSLAHRKKVRDALASDPQWTGEYVAKILPYLNKQTNVFTRAMETPVIVDEKRFPFWRLTKRRGADLTKNKNTVVGFQAFAALEPTVYGLEGFNELDTVTGNAADPGLVLYPAAFAQQYCSNLLGPK